MSFENPNKNNLAQEQSETSRKGRVAQALLSLSNGLIAKKTKNSAESGFVLAALEKVAEIPEAPSEFNSEAQ